MRAGTRSRITLAFAAVAAAALMLAAWPLAWNAERQVRESARERQEAFLAEAGRVAQQSLYSEDDLMLIGHLKTLRGLYPEIQYAQIRLRSHTVAIGARRPSTLLRAASVDAFGGRRLVSIGFDPAVADFQAERSAGSVPPALLSLLGLLLGLIALAATLAAPAVDAELERERRRLETLSGELRSALREAVVPAPVRAPLRAPTELDLV